MHENNDDSEVCCNCGSSFELPENNPHLLRQGSMLNKRYMVGALLGEGGFGITYVGWDNVLDIKVAVKEFFPHGMVTRNSSVSDNVEVMASENACKVFNDGKKHFLAEARILAKLSGEAGIVNVKDFFEENNTAYIIMEFLEGITLNDYLKLVGKVEYDNAVCLLMPVILSLSKVHKEKLLHRDISCDNIMLVDSDVKLIDFGSARRFDDQHSFSLTLKQGYSPIEQYKRNGDQGPWTDIYALCATIYRCITGLLPVESVDRIYEDQLQKPSDIGIEIDPMFEDVLMKGLALRRGDRWQSIEQFVEALISIPALGIRTEDIYPFKQRTAAAPVKTETPMMPDSEREDDKSSDYDRKSAYFSKNIADCNEVRSIAKAELNAFPDHNASDYNEGMDDRMSVYFAKKVKENRVDNLNVEKIGNMDKNALKYDPDYQYSDSSAATAQKERRKFDLADKIKEKLRSNEWLNTEKKNEKNHQNSSSATIYYKPQLPKAATILIIDKDKKPIIFPLSGSMTMGRDYEMSDRDIRIRSKIVSRSHGEFIFDDSDGSYYYIDNNSYNGTFINGEKLLPYNSRGSKAVKLSDGDIIRIDQENLSEPHPEAVLIIFSTYFTKQETWKCLNISQYSRIMIGRGDDCDLKLNDLMVSKEHAVLYRNNSRWVIKDNDSMNGICLNGEDPGHPAVIFPNDVIRLGNTTIIFTGDRILYNVPNEKRNSMIVNIRDRTVSSGKVLLRDINAEFCGGDFVLVLGGSGAGKTTLIKSILGESRANGKIILNGQDLYKNFKSMKSQIGMVPQFLTLRKGDTVLDTLMDTAAIKMGRSYSKKERLERVNRVIEQVGIKEHADKLIGDLSGGQQKKVSVANQLIGFQKVFICDEPDSGLDAASRMQQMEILKEISDDGKIVIVISHEPDDAVEIVNGEKRILFTKVLVLARSSEDRAGHLAFFGDIHKAMRFFEVERLQDIMMKINPPEEGGQGLADAFIEKYRRSKEHF